MNALLPATLLLLWSGLAATLLASLVLAPLADVPAGALSPAPAQPRLLSALLLGTFVLPLLYGIGFALLQEASLLTGALLGAVHAGVLGARSLLSGGRTLARQNARRMLIRVAYGILLGFAYTVP